MAERSLVALGAKTPTCVELLDAWRGARETHLLPDLLLGHRTLSPEELAGRRANHERELESVLRRPRRLRTALGKNARLAGLLGQLEAQATLRLSAEKRMWELTLIDALPAAFRRTLGLSVIVQVERNWHDEAYRHSNGKQVESALDAVVAPLFEQSARLWRRNLRPYAGFSAESWLLAPDEEPTCAAWVDGGGVFGVLSLPVSWFVDVWARGIALVEGCLVLGLAGDPEEHAALPVIALRWERGSRQTSKSVEAPALVSRGRDGEWLLRWV